MPAQLDDKIYSIKLKRLNYIHKFSKAAESPKCKAF